LYTHCLYRLRRPNATSLSASEIERLDKAAHVAFRRDAAG
jgi:hypothetical protein